MIGSELNVRPVKSAESRPLTCRMMKVATVSARNEVGKAELAKVELLADPVVKPGRGRVGVEITGVDPADRLIRRSEGSEPPFATGLASASCQA